VLLLPLVVLTSGASRLSEVLHSRRALAWLACSGVLIGSNWPLFIYAVVSARVLEASLGYFINPLVSLVLGMVFLGERLRPLHRILEKKYGFDELYQTVFADGGRRLGGFLSRVGDQRVIDDWIVNGAARVVGRGSGLMRHLQSGYLYHYAFAMILGVLVALSWILLSA
jgi:NADH-quinone oxidoreductase subunit L